MSSVIIMPRLGLNEDEVENLLGEWHVKEGDHVQKGDELFSVETDKSSMTVYAEEEGTILKCLWGEYSLVPVMSPVCILGDEGEDISALLASLQSAPAAEEPAAESPAVPASAAPTPVIPESPAAAGPDLHPVSPRARKLAEANGIDAALLPPSGAEGRVIEADVRKAIAAVPQVPVSAPAATTPAATQTEAPAAFPAQVATPAAGSFTAASAPDAAQPEPIRVPLTPTRRAIARNMYNSLRNMAQTSDSVEIDVTDLMALAKKLQEKKDALGVKIGINDLLSYACVRMAKQHPAVNARYTDQEILQFPYVNLSSAVDTSYGLTSPVLYDADKLSLIEFSKQLHALIDRARNHKLTLRDQSNATLTVTNMGVFPCDAFNPIVPEGCSLIVGFGRCVEKPAVWQGQICIRWRMILSVTYDHRCFDGGQIGRVLRTMVEFLETPELFLIQ